MSSFRGCNIYVVLEKLLMCLELTVRYLSGEREQFLIPFPNTWNYIINAVAESKGFRVSEVNAFYEGYRVQYNATDPTGQYVQFGTPWPVIDVIFRVAGNSTDAAKLSCSDSNYL